MMNSPPFRVVNRTSEPPRPARIGMVTISLYSFNGWGVTVFDSLSTMWLMGLREEFGAAVESVQDHYLKMEQVNV